MSLHKEDCKLCGDSYVDVYDNGICIKCTMLTNIQKELSIIRGLIENERDWHFEERRKQGLCK